VLLNRSDRWEKGYSLYEIPEISRNRMLKLERIRNENFHSYSVKRGHVRILMRAKRMVNRQESRK
jgi:hypothetical protein